MNRLSNRNATLLLILAGTVVRLWLAAITGLGYDESYMVGNARQFVAGTVDHPPLHVWLVWAATHLAGGSEAPVVVRLPFILLFAGSTWLMFRFTARLFGEGAGVWAAVAFNLAPVFSLADATWVLPDGPMIFFLLASATVVARILFDPPAPRHVWLWLAAGALAGLALLSKFTAAYFLLAVFVYLLTVPRDRPRLATPGPWLGALAALVVVSPALIWNAQQGFAGILFQSGRIAQPSFRVERLAAEIGGGLLYLTPWLAVPFAISLFNAFRRGRGDRHSWLTALAAIGPIATFAFVALFSRTLPHWAMPGWLFAIPLFGRDAAALYARRPVFARRYMEVAAGVFLVLVAAFAWQATRGGLVPQSVIATNPASDPTIDLIEWRPLAERLDEAPPVAPLVVAAPNWFSAGKASYALGPGVPVLCLCTNPQQFAYRLDQRSFAGSDVVVVLPQGRNRDTALRYFDRLDPLPPVTVTRGGETALRLDLAIGRNLQFP